MRKPKTSSLTPLRPDNKAVNNKEKKEVKNLNIPSSTLIPAVSPSAAVKAQPVQGNTAKQEAAALNEIVLTVRAKKNSWLKVKADDRVVFQSTLTQGDIETWRGTDSIEISGKNINQLEFELNGKMIGTLGRDKSKAKVVIFTKDGLTVPK